MFVSSECLGAFANISSRPRCSFLPFSFIYSCLSFPALRCKLKASLLPNFIPHLHPPMSWLYLFSIPVALSLHTHTHTHKPSSELYSRGKYFVQQRRCLTVPYVKFSLHCAPTFFCNWIISLAANPTSVVLGDFTTSYLPFISVWTSTFCCLQL